MAKKVKRPKLASKFLLGTALTFYGNGYFTKKAKIVHDGVLKNLKSPYVVVANHSSFADVGGLIYSMYPTCASFVISQTQIVKWPKLIYKMGILPKKQFAVDTSLIRDIKYVLSKGRPVVIYPEGKISVVGRPSIIKPAIAKLVKMLKVPLVCVRFDGSYLHQPRWSRTKRNVPVRVTAKVLGAEDLNAMTVDQIHQHIVDSLAFDDYAYQLANKIEVDIPTLTEGLHNILYQCPVCGAQFATTSHGNTLGCAKCGMQVTQNSLGQLVGGKFDKVTDWYAWQVAEVRKSLLDGSYTYSMPFTAQKLVGKNYVDLGDATITHDQHGITVSLPNEQIHYKAGAFYTLSFNNDYVYLPTPDAVLRFKKQGNDGCTTKLNIAVEQQTSLLEGKNIL